MNSSRPHSNIAEKAILGAILIDGNLALQHCHRLRPEMLALDSHRRIYGLMVDMLANGSTLDYLTLKDALEKRKCLETIGGLGYLTDLGNDLPRHFNPAPQVEIVIEKWKLREVMRIGHAFMSRASEEENAGELLAEMQGEVMNVLSESEAQDEPLVRDYSIQELNTLLEQAGRPGNEVIGLSYGIPALDEFTEGMRPGEVTAVGARSGVGKSSLMVQAAAANARRGIPVHLFSLEMTRAQILRRLWCIESKVSYSHLRKPSSATNEDIEAISAAALRVAEWPLRIHDKAEMDLTQILARARLSIRQYGTQLLCVDYAQNVEAEGRDERTKVSRVSRLLTKLAKDERVHLMLLSQLRKVPPEMYSKPPHVGDLRETGQIENDAHIILLLHRPWDEALATIETDGEIIVPKQREGGTGAIRVKFNKHTLSFEFR